MITDGEKDVLARLLQRLEAETERLDRLEADNAQLRSEIDSLRRRRPTPSTSASTEDHGDVSPCDDHDQPLSRRGMLSRLAGAGAAGLGLAAGASVLAVKPAGATDVGALQLGHDNLAGVNRTLLQSSSNFPTLQVGNVGFGEGVFAYAERMAVVATSSLDVGVSAHGGRAPLSLNPHHTVGPPNTGFHDWGDVMLDVTGAMFVCRVSGTPGLWTRVGFNGVRPTRIADTRPGTGTPYSTGPIGPGAEREITVAGVAGVPAAPAHSLAPLAGAVVMNATAVSPTASSYITIYPSGVDRPVASNLNVVRGGPPTPNLVIVKLGTGGKVRVFNASGSVHIILDVAGFFS